MWHLPDRGITPGQSVRSESHPEPLKRAAKPREL